MSTNPQDEAALEAERVRAQARAETRAALFKRAHATADGPEAANLTDAAHEARLALRVALAALRED